MPPSTPALSTNVLLRRVAHGDRGAFAGVVDDIGEHCWQVVRVIVGADTARAAQAYTEAFVEVWRRAPEFDPTGQVSARSWVLSIAQTRANQYRNGADGSSYATVAG